MSQRMRVAVLMGGRTSEHEVSLSSGSVVVQHLDPARYQTKPVKIEKDGAWCVPPSFPGTGMLDALKQDGAAWRLTPGQALARLEEDQVDVAVLALHGAYGEDGTVQGMLEMAGIPYTGAGVAGSALAIDKLLTKELLLGAGVTTPPYLVVTRGRWEHASRELAAQIGSRLGYPAVCKLPRMGSSIGMGIAETLQELGALMGRLFAMGEEVLVEEHIAGRELTCGVLARPGGGLDVLPVTEIRPRAARFFDYRSKYVPGASEEVTPAPLAEHARVKVQATALRVHRLLRCGPLSRTDMILARSGELFVLETNTLPGMTPTSLVPQAAAAAGIPFPRLLDRLVLLALEAAPPRVAGIPRCATSRRVALLRREAMGS